MMKKSAKNSSPSEKQQFSTRLGVIAATVGSAVGLGNIWRFPYEAGNNGGAAFLFVYIFFVVVIGIPVICGEFVIGRSTHLNIAGAFRKLKARPFWSFPAFTGILASVLIIGFYSVVAGWTVYYLYESFAGFGGATTTPELHARFDAFTGSAWQSLLFTFIFLACNFLVILRGVQKGIEKISSVMTPLLVIILVAFCVNSFFMPGAKEGLEFLFRPDFGALTARGVLSAMGQAFFSLSVGMGVLATYASYFNDRTSLVRTATGTSVSDTIVAILAGVMIFPAVFSFGLQPEAGPRLVFEVLPSVFMQLPAARVWSALFFLLLFMASLTSTISLTEVIVAYIMQEWKMSRGKATAIVAALAAVLATVCALSFGALSDVKIAGLNIFNFLDFTASNILMPLGGMILAPFVGWRMEKRLVMKQLIEDEKRDENEATREIRTGEIPLYVRLIIFSLKYVAPICIFLVFIFGLL